MTAAAMLHDSLLTGPTARRSTAPRVAYLMSRFPKLTETFILYEILAVERQGIEVEIYPLLRARNSATHPEGAGVLRKLVELLRRPNGQATMHPEAVPLVARARFAPWLSRRILAANARFLFARPRAYLGALATLVRANWGSMNYLAGGLALFPKTVYFAAQIEADGIDHVHAHFANHPAAAAFVIHRLTGIPYSFTAHGADLQVDQHMLREKVAEADHVVSISEYNRELLVAHCGEEYRDKVAVVRCGVDTSLFQPVKREPQTADETLRILCVGTLYEVKGQAYLIEACRQLVEQGVALECRLVGDGPDREKLQAQAAAARLNGAVQFLGQRTRYEILELLRAASVLVVPSIPTSSGRREGIPVVLMEAMASGLPVVASGISGIPELVIDEENGLLVPPRDPAALAAALARLGEDAELRRRLGEAGRDKVVREFDLEASAAKLASLFRREEGR